MTAQLNRALDALPQNQQLVIHLKFHDELTYRQIATLTNRTVESVNGLLRRAFSTLRKAFGVDPRAATGTEGT